jgi:uncharacterized membrane protein
MDMERTVVDPLVEDYLRRLDAAAYPLGEDRRSELLAGIREHIEASVESGEVHDEASLRALLDRLGDPEEIVAAARDDDAPGATPYPLGSPPPVAYRRAGIGLEITAALFLTVGSVLFVIGWLVGVVLVWSSRRWTLGEKLVATLVFPGGPFAVVFLAGTVSGTESCFSSTETAGLDGPVIGTPVESCTTSGFVLPQWLGIPLLLAWLVLPIVVAGVLVMRARRRADVEPPVLVTPGAPSRWGGLEIAAVLLIGLGAFVLPVIGIVAGLVCAWLSDQWTRTEKWIATAIASTCLIVPIVAAVALFAVRTSS